MNLPNRKSPRLKGFDYSSSNMYFVTINTQNRQCLFGEINNGQMELSNLGQMISKYWKKISEKWSNIQLDVFIVMPDHFHGIIILNNEIVGDDPCVVPKENLGGHTGPPLPSLTKVIQWFKTMTTNQCIKMVKQNLCPPFQIKLWQRSFYDHIIRNDKDYYNHQKYITENPAKWEYERFDN